MKCSPVSHKMLRDVADVIEQDRVELEATRYADTLLALADKSEEVDNARLDISFAQAVINGMEVYKVIEAFTMFGMREVCSCRESLKLYRVEFALNLVIVTL